MASLRDIRKRIKSVKNTRQITKAMKMVAAAKLRRAQEAITAARPYARTLDTVVSELMAKQEGETLGHALMEKRAETNIEILVLTGDRGLAGGFNSNVNRTVLKFAKENAEKYTKIEFTTIGRKGNDFLRLRGMPARKDHPGAASKPNYATAEAVAQELAARFTEKKVDAVYVVYNEFRSAISQGVMMTKLLPFEASAAADANVEYVYEPSSTQVLEQLIPKALAVRVYRAMLESCASEHGARMTAMENATKNAGEMIGTLTLYYNRTRQAGITKELMEIVSGAESLKG